MAETANDSIKLTIGNCTVEVAFSSDLDAALIALVRMRGILGASYGQGEPIPPAPRAQRVDAETGPLEREYLERTKKAWMRCPKGMDREDRARELLGGAPDEPATAGAPDAPEVQAPDDGAEVY